MPLVKRLYITASDAYGKNKQIIPVNSPGATTVESKIGQFGVKVSIRDFDGAKPHLSNSYYNQNSTQPLIHDEDKVQDDSVDNLVIEIGFVPHHDIPSSDLIFGNDLTVAIKDMIPATLLSTGLKFFTWFINKTIKADIYSDTPFLYGLAINSFTHINLGTKPEPEENLGDIDGLDDSLHIPPGSAERMKYFLDINHCKKYVFQAHQPYTFVFETNFVKMMDSKYAVAIPTFGSKTFDIDVSSYANAKLDNFNWVVKQNGIDGFGKGDLGLVVNFALLEEEEEESEVD